MGKQKVGDLEQIRQRLEQWLADKLGIEQGFVLSPLNFPELGGESSVTLLVDASWLESGRERLRKFVVRMVPQVSEIFESHDLLMQYQLMEIMHKEGVPAPSLVGFESDSSLLGSEFYVMDFVDGLIPPDNPPIAFGGWVVDDLSAEQRAQMWRNGLQTMAKIHQIDITQYDLSRLPQAAANEPYLAHEFRRYDGIIANGLRDTADPIILEAWDYLKANAPEDGPKRLCWGDSRPGNMIWRDLKPVAVIDWEIACIGDPLMDLSWWLWIDQCLSVGLGFEKISGLPEFDEAYAQWHEITGLPIDNIAYFELLTLVQFAIILERKFLAGAVEDPNFNDMPNYVVQFLPSQLALCRGERR